MNTIITTNGATLSDELDARRYKSYDDTLSRLHTYTHVECWHLDDGHFAHFDKCGGDRKHRLTTDEVGELAETLAAEGWVIDWSQCVPGNFAAHPPEWAAERARWEAAHPDPDPGVL